MLTGLTNQELFLQGNKSYKAERFQEALGLYQSINAKGWAVYYNMGNCWYQQEHYINALLYWQKAMKLAEYGSLAMIEANCAQAYEALGQQPPDSRIGSLRYKMSRAPFIIWQFIFLLSLLLLAIAAPWFIRKKHTHVFCLLTMMVMAQGAALGYSAHVRSQQSALTIKSFELVAGTDHNFSKCGVISQGTPVRILAHHDSWCKVSNGTSIGWLPDDCIEII